MMNLSELKNNNQVPFQQSSLKALRFIPGLWVDGKCYWLQNNVEKVLYEKELILKVKQEQVHSKVCFSNLYVSNHSSRTKEIKILVMYHHANASKDNFTFVSPTDNRIFHLINNDVYLVHAQLNGEGMKECTIQPFWNVFTDLIWSSLQKGSLLYQPMFKGTAASIFAIKMYLKPRETNKITSWLIGGDNKSELISMDQALLNCLASVPRGSGS